MHHAALSPLTASIGSPAGLAASPLGFLDPATARLAGLLGYSGPPLAGDLRCALQHVHGRMFDVIQRSFVEIFLLWDGAMLEERAF